jgi:REP element-mobilizing transposase RayT
MARKLRIQFPGAIYHVMSRGDRREDIFRDDFDRESFLQALADVCGRTSWQVHAFCLMPNHFHLVVETPQSNLAAGMKWFLGTYTARFNRRHKLSGHVFAGRYKSLLVGGEGGYLRTVCDYVHLNPVRARLLPAGAAIRDYRWSSFVMIAVTPSQRPDWLRIDRLLGEHGIGLDSVAGRREFERRLEARRAQESETEFQPVRRGWCFGDEQFRQDLLARVEDGAGQYHYGTEIREAAEAKASRIIDEELRRSVWTEAELGLRRKGDPVKVQIAQRLRAETTVTLQWIAARLRMGTKTHLSHLLYWTRRKQKERISSTSARRNQEAITMPSPRRTRLRNGNTGNRSRGQNSITYPVQPKEDSVITGNESLPLTDPFGAGGFDTSFD